MPVIRNKLSSTFAGGPRQFAELRNKVIIRSDEVETEEVKGELAALGLEFEKLDNAPIFLGEPVNRLDQFLDRITEANPSRTVQKGIEQVGQALDNDAEVIDITDNAVEATDRILTALNEIDDVTFAEFVRSEADFGPQNLRIDVQSRRAMDEVEAKESPGNIEDLYERLGIYDAWDEHDTRGENAIYAVFDTGYAEDLIDSSRIVGTFHDDSVDSVFASAEGHGTMCAGCAVANSDENPPIDGVAPDADVVLVRTTGADGQIKTDTIANAWDWLVDQEFDKPVVANHSYGTPICSGRPRQNFCGSSINEMVRLATSDSNITAVYAAGNEAMRCFPADTKITTTKGQKRIEDVEIDDYVVTHAGSIERVIDTMCRRSNDDMVEINPHYGESIICTHDHPILVKDESSIFCDGIDTEWKEAKDVTRNDKIVVPRFERDDRVPEEIEVPNYNYDGQTEKYEKVMRIRNESGAGPKKLNERTGVPIGTIQSWIYDDVTPRNILELPDSVQIDEDIAKLIGYFVAEGHADENRVTFGLHDDETEIISEIKRIIHEKFNSKISIEARSKEGKSTSLEINCSPFSEFFKEMCGNSSDNKQFPNWGPYHDEEIVKALIQGYYAGDGWSKEPSRHSMSTQSEELAYQVKLMMARLGAVTGISVADGDDTSEINGREIERNGERYRVYSSKGTDSISVMENATDVVAADGATQHQPTKAEIGEDELFVEVDEVEEADDVEYVYNIEVENDHSYIANGVAVHNCGHRPSGFTNAITGTNSINSVITVGAMLTNGQGPQRYSSHGRGDCAPISDPKPNVAMPIPMITYYGGEDGFKLKDLSTGVAGSGGGTSHASPTTAGIITLMQSKAAANSEPLQTEEIKNKLHETANPPRTNHINNFGLLFSQEGYDARYGHGQVQVSEALSRV